MEIAEAFVSIRPQTDAQGFSRDVDRQIRGPLKSATDRASRDAKVKPGVDGRGFAQDLATQVSRPAASAASQLRGLFARVGVGLAIRQSIAEVRDANRAARETATLIKTTGNAANFSEEQTARLVATLQEYAGVDDDVIRGGTNLLRTFKGIREEMGAGNDIITRTSRAALDMAAIFNTDVNGAFIQLGKALENPKQGLLALRRIGVTFTEDQQRQIKGLQEQGNLLQAQRVILDAIEGQVGGAAGAAADDVQRASVRIHNSMEQLGAAILPPIGKVAQAVASIAEVFSALPAPVQQAVVAGVGIGLIAGPAVSAATAVKGLGLSFLRVLAPTVAETAALQAEAVAAGEAATANTANAVAMDAEAVSAGTATGALTLLRGALTASVGAGGLAASLGQLAVVAAAGYGAFKLEGAALDQLVEASPEVDKLAKSLQQYVKDGKDVSDVTDRFGKGFSDIARQVEDLQGTTSLAAKLNHAFNPLVSSDERGIPRLNADLRESKANFEALDNAIAKLARDGDVAGAQKLFLQIVEAGLAGGTSLDLLARKFPKTVAGLHDLGNAQDDAGKKVDQHAKALDRAKKALDSFNAVFGRSESILTTQLDLADATDRAADAQKNLADAQADAAGTGPKAVAAAKAEADARKSLTDAIESQADAQRSLLDARRSLADFESGTSATIRALERQQIISRLGTTPEDARQKEIDLLSFDQNTSEEHARLREGVAEAERGVQDAKQKTVEANQAVIEAEKERKQVAIDAAGDIAAAERDVERAFLAVAEAAKAVAEAAAKSKDPYVLARIGAREYLDTLIDLRKGVEDGSPLAKALDGLIARLVRLGLLSPEPGPPPVSVGGPTGIFPHRARGGPLGEGFTWVGENGPELVSKRGGYATVLSNETVRALERTRDDAHQQMAPVTHLELARLSRSISELARRGPSRHVEAPIHQEIHANEMPTRDALEVANRHLAWELSLMGRRGTG